LKKVRSGVWISLAIALAGTLVLAALYRLRDNPNKYAFLQTVVLFLTLIALVFYTHFTRKMQQAMVKQTTINVLPVFVAHIGDVQRREGESHYFDLFELENIGNGVALNVRVDTVDITWRDPQVNEVWPMPRIVFDGVMAIKSDERVSLKHRSTIDVDGRSPGDRFDWMDKLRTRADFDYELHIRFSDVLGNRYIQTIHTGVSGIWPDVVVNAEDAKRTRLTNIPQNRFVHSPLRFARRIRSENRQG